MARIPYEAPKVRKSTHATISQACEIIEEYKIQNLTLTIRQLYYQFVTRLWLPNNPASYNRVGRAVKTGRLLGLIDWNDIEDRTRTPHGNEHFDNPKQALEHLSTKYQIDKWFNQKWRPEVWVEKDAALGFVGDVCLPLDVTYFSGRGFVSASALHVAAMRMMDYMAAGQTPVIIYVGDLDPSGIVIRANIQERLMQFCGGVDFVDLVITPAQVREYKLNANPINRADSRQKKYFDKHGDKTYELDSMNPTVLSGLIRAEVLKYRDEAAWKRALKVEVAHKKRILKVSKTV